MDAGVFAFTRAQEEVEVVAQFPDVVADPGDQAVGDAAIVADAGHHIAALGGAQGFFMRQVLLRVIVHGPEQHVRRQRRVADEQAADAQVVEARGIEFDFIRIQIIGLGQCGLGGDGHRGGRSVERQEAHAVHQLITALQLDMVADLDRRHAPRIGNGCIGQCRTIGLRTQGITIGGIREAGTGRTTGHSRRGIHAGTLCRQAGPGPRHPTGDAHRIAGD